MSSQPKKRDALSIKVLLKPHSKALGVGILAVIGEGIANLLEPWPLKVVLDIVLKSRQSSGWLNHFILSAIGQDKLTILKYAAAAALVIAAFGALCSYAEKYLTTSVGQWVMHDLRRTLYSHIQRLSLAYHDQKQTGPWRHCSLSWFTPIPAASRRQRGR
jgi:ATP-binding cassette subfamily B protein